MSLWLVNKTPPTELMKPSGFLQFSLKSDSARPRIGTLMVKLGISRLLHNKKMPELDENLTKYGEVSYTSPDRAVPYTGECLRSLSSGRIIITKTTDDTADLGVYEYRVPVSPNGSSLAYFRIRKHQWGVGARPWIAADSVTGLRLGVISGIFQTSCDLFLRDDGGDGTLLVTGPTNGPSRSHETEYAFPWKTVPEDGTIDLWIHLNSETATFEVWGSLAGATVSLIASVGVAELYANAATVEDFFTAYFGNGGFAGDVLDVEDWGVYPDFRDVVSESNALPGNSITFLPDSPAIYRAEGGKLPGEHLPCRWFPFGTFDASFGYSPGTRVTPQNVVLDKYLYVGDEKVAYSGRAVFEREEPVLAARSSGFMMEALVSGFAKHIDVEAFGAGIGVNDGLYSYRALLYKTATKNTIALQSNNDQTSVAEQYDAGHVIEWESPRLVRLTLDRDRQKVSMWVDDELVVSHVLGKYFPKTRKSGVEFGHLLDVTSMGQLHVGYVNYLTKYRAYEATDGVEPNGATPAFDLRKVDINGQVASSMWMGDGALHISKPAVHARNTRHDFFRADRIDSASGALVDFRARVPIFWDTKGTPMAASSYTGAGLQLHLGTKVLKFGFFNCGIHGKYIGVVPGSGTVNDIISQSALGRLFSAPVDWTKMETYRIVFRGYDKIEIWAGKTTNLPAIVIPWRNDTDGFDLIKEEQGHEAGISFGHDDGFSGSVSEWEFVRWGASSGYDIAVAQGYPNGVRPDQFGGKSLLLTDIVEDT